MRNLCVGNVIVISSSLTSFAGFEVFAAMIRAFNANRGVILACLTLV